MNITIVAALNQIKLIVWKNIICKLGSNSLFFKSITEYPGVGSVYWSGRGVPALWQTKIKTTTLTCKSTFTKRKWTQKVESFEQMNGGR